MVKIFNVESTEIETEKDTEGRSIQGHTLQFHNSKSPIDKSHISAIISFQNKAVQSFKLYAHA